MSISQIGQLAVPQPVAIISKLTPYLSGRNLLTLSGLAMSTSAVQAATIEAAAQTVVDLSVQCVSGVSDISEAEVPGVPMCQQVIGMPRI